MNLPETYRKTTDLLAYGELNAPSFPAEDRMDLSAFFERVLSHYEYLLSNERDGVAMQWLLLSKQDVIAARQLFTETKNNDGSAKLSSAGIYLSNAKNKKPIKPTFIAGDAGFAE